MHKTLAIGIFDLLPKAKKTPIGKQKIIAKAEIINKNGYMVPVFEVKISKNILLYDQNEDLVKQENETVSVDGVNGPEIILGSLSKVSTNGNWPTIFDAKRE